MKRYFRFLLLIFIFCSVPLFGAAYRKSQSGEVEKTVVISQGELDREIESYKSRAAWLDSEIARLAKLKNTYEVFLSTVTAEIESLEAERSASASVISDMEALRK